MHVANSLETLKVSVLLEHNAELGSWRAEVPLVPGAQEEGLTVDEAAQNIIPVIELFAAEDPEITKELRRQPEFQLRRVDVNLNRCNAA